MNNEARPYIVYAMTDEKDRIIAVDSSAFVDGTDRWTEIDRGFSEKYMHAQNYYFDKPITDERGIYRYKLENSKPVERTQEEMDADYAARPAPPPSDKERIAQLEEELAAAKILLGLEV